MIQNFFRSRLNRLTYGCVVAMAVFFLALAGNSGLGENLGPHGSFLYYFSITAASFGHIILGAAYFAAAFLIAIVTFSLLHNFADLARGKKGLPTMLGRSSVTGVFVSAAKKVGAMLFVIAPALFFTVLMSFTLDSLNAINKTRLMDNALINIERAAIGNYGFAVVSGAPYPYIVIRFIILSFEGMSGLVLAAAIVIACVRLDILRELVAAFCFCMALMVPLWLAFPALSPQDRFIDNTYHLPVSAGIALAAANFHPVPPIADFLGEIRTGKRGLVDLPTSTLPSAHTAWAVLVGFYLFRAKKWLGWIALPFLVGSTLGTVILAQHYLIDPIVGIIIAGFAIVVVEKMADQNAIHVGK